MIYLGGYPKTPENSETAVKQHQIMHSSENSMTHLR